MATRKKKVVEEAVEKTGEEVIEVPAVAGVDTAAMAKVATDSRFTARSRLALVESLTITGPEEYQTMDSHLGDIRKDKAVIDNLFNNEETGLIRPIRVGLDRLYAFQRALLKPLIEVEDLAKGRMAAYQLEEKKARDEREAVERERIRKVQAEIDAKRKADEPAVRVSAMPTVVAAPTTAVQSSTAFVEKVRVTSVSELIEAIEAGLVPKHIGYNLLIVDDHILNVWFKTDPEEVRACPGLEVYEDAQIRGRR